jgi:hypothetical protein
MVRTYEYQQKLSKPYVWNSNPGVKSPGRESCMGNISWSEREHHTTEHDNQHVQLDKGPAKASSSTILIFRSCFCVAVVEVTVEKWITGEEENAE